MKAQNILCLFFSIFALLYSRDAYPQDSFITKWIYNSPTGSYTDGISAGYLASGGLIVANLSDSNHLDGIYGKMVVLNSNGSVLYSSAPRQGRDVVGYTLVHNADNLGFSEIYYGESNNDAIVYGLRGSYSTMFKSQGYIYPSYYNMGPSAGDISVDSPGLELVIPSWGGKLTVLNPISGSVIYQYDLLQNLGEYISGHAAIGDIFLELPGEEIAVFGAAEGQVLVFGSGVNGYLNLLYQSDINTGYAEGSGPAIADIDLDGNLEIIVAGVGTKNVVAYDVIHGTHCKYNWNVSGEDYYYTSPVVGDIVTSEFGLEIAIESIDSIVEVLQIPDSSPVGDECLDGGIIYQKIINGGEPAWFTPGLANISGGSGLDIVAASYTTLEVIDVEGNRVSYRYSDSSAYFYPSPIILRNSIANPSAVIVSGWGNGKIYRLDTKRYSPMPTRAWPHSMGNIRRNGFSN